MSLRRLAPQMFNILLVIIVIKCYELILCHFVQIYEELDKRLCMFNKNYMILEDFLKDASHRLEVLLKNGYSVISRRGHSISGRGLM